MFERKFEGTVQKENLKELFKRKFKGMCERKFEGTFQKKI